MPDDDTMLSQGTVDFRNEERRARNEACEYRFECVIDESAGMAELSMCTEDKHCRAPADEHFDTCPVEQRLREEIGF